MSSSTMSNSKLNATARSISIFVIASTFITLMSLGGSYYYIAAFVITLVFVGLDLVAGMETSDPSNNNALQMNASLYMVAPVMLWFLVVYAWFLGGFIHPHSDPLSLGASLDHLTGLNLLAARSHTTLPELIVGAYCLGSIWAAYGTIVGHELTHRTWSKPAMIVGRWLLALTLDASFAIEHVYGHHLNLGTPADPATAQRGENVYHFLFRSTFGQIKGSWHIEANRLARSGYGVWTWRNRMFSGWAMSAAYAALFYVFAGWQGMLVFIGVALFGKCYLEAVNFIEHYGIVRVPGTAVEPRHSWNCNHRVSSWLFFNLTRHSHHHAMADKPYWELRAYPDAPMMPFGYLTMIYVALIPALFRRVVDPRVLHWDQHFAAPSEYHLIDEANDASKDRNFVGVRAHRSAMVAAE